MDNVKFAKAMRESGLVDKKLQLSSVGVIFLSVKQPTARKISYEEFLGCLSMVADQKKEPIADVVRAVLGAQPQVTGTIADAVGAARPKERGPPQESEDPYSIPLSSRPKAFYAAVKPDGRPVEV